MYPTKKILEYEFFVRGLATNNKKLRVTNHLFQSYSKTLIVADNISICSPLRYMYPWIKYGFWYDTQGILGNIPIIVIPHSYMSYLRLFENVC